MATGPLKLLDLPTELRYQIFSYVVYPDDADISAYKYGLPTIPPLLFVSRQVRKEAGEAFISEVPITLSCTCRWTDTQDSHTSTLLTIVSAPKETLEWLRAVGADLLPSLRSCLLAAEVIWSEYPVARRLFHSNIYKLVPGSNAYDFEAHYLDRMKGYLMLCGGQLETSD